MPKCEFNEVDGQTHLKDSSAKVDKLFLCVCTFCGVGDKRVKTGLVETRIIKTIKYKTCSILEDSYLNAGENDSYIYIFALLESEYLV